MYRNKISFVAIIKDRTLFLCLTLAFLAFGCGCILPNALVAMKGNGDTTRVVLEPPSAKDPTQIPAEDVSANTTTHSELPDSIIAYYFHRTLRCETCIKMEACILEVINHDCLEALKDGTLRWRPLDYEQPENAEYAERFQLSGPALVLSHWADGREVLCAGIDEIWAFTDDTEAVGDRLRGQFEECLTGKCRHDEFFAPDTSDVPIPGADSLRSEER